MFRVRAVAYTLGSDYHSYMSKSLTVDADIFTRGVEDIVTKTELAERLRTRRKLRIKLGIDATGELHIGHAVNLWKIRALQELGHKAVIIIGEFTTRISDPTGRAKSRPILTGAEIRKNSLVIKREVGRVLRTDREVFELRRNTEWYNPMKAGKFLELASLVTHARLIERDMFQERIRQGTEITVSEFLYPILQGYDSVMVHSDCTIIGSDQLFNEHFGRLFQEKFGQPPQVIMTHRILPGIGGGEKMSKSLGNTINLSDTPDDKFGKAMRIPDELVIPYLEAYTDEPMDRIHEWQREIATDKNPMEVKLALASALVRRYHGDTAALRSHAGFLKRFSAKSTDTAVSVSLPEGTYAVAELLVRLGFASSKSEARRLVIAHAVRIDGNVWTDASGRVEILHGTIVQAGRRRIAKIL